MKIIGVKFQTALREGAYWGDPEENFSESVAAESGKQTKQISEGNQEKMSAKAKSVRKPRGGLAADAAALKAKTPRTRKAKAGKVTEEKKVKAEGTGSKGRLGKLFESSVVRVIMAAGKAGATKENTLKALAEHGIKAAEATVARNLYLGKSGKEKGADLTEAQLAEFGV